jgi:hypothetical protein
MFMGEGSGFNLVGRRNQTDSYQRDYAGIAFISPFPLTQFTCLALQIGINMMQYPSVLTIKPLNPEPRTPLDLYGRVLGLCVLGKTNIYE